MQIYKLKIIIINQKRKGYSEIIAVTFTVTTPSIFIKSEIFAFWELNPERNSENMPPFNHKTALNLKFEKKSLVIFFKRIISQPSVRT